MTRQTKPLARMLARLAVAAALVAPMVGPAPAWAQATEPSLVRVEAVRYEPLTQTVPVIGRLIRLIRKRLAVSPRP